MPSVDSNILLRYIVKDNQEQAESARRFLDKLTPQQPGFICREVIQEFVWVLERTYKFPREQIAELVFGLTSTAGFVVETTDDIANAAELYAQTNDDFSDLMILAAAERVGAKPLYTFDRKLARMEGATLLAEPLS